MPSPSLDEEVIKSLKIISDKFDGEDRATRESQIRRYQRLKLYWNNMSQTYWSDKAGNYKLGSSLDDSSDDDQSYYDRPVNVYKAFLETIIAALSVQIPAITCVPNDADNPMDLSTAKAGNKIAERIYKQNDVMFLWLQALYVYCTEGLIACHHYVKEDAAYGTYDEKIYKDQDVESYVCPECQSQLADETFTQPQAGFEEDELADNPNPEGASPDFESSGVSPEELDSESLDLGTQESQMPQCPNCGAPLDSNMAKVKLTIPSFVGNETRNKARVCMEVYGGLYVKVANYAKKQEDTPYLAFDYETHYVNAIEMYPRLKDKIGRTQPNRAMVGSSLDSYEQLARLNPQYLGKTPEDNVTVKNRWFRPAAFNVLPKEQTDELRRLFPDGCKVVFVNEECASYYKSKLDDEWTLTRNPLSDFLTHEPLGELLVNIQDIVNDLISLTIQTIEHGIEQTWADPAVVSFNGQSQIEATPGMITAAKASTGKNISDGFFSTKPATLSAEVFTFYKIVQELGQFVSGAMPSIFGGAQMGKTSGTASEYAMSKSMALQRLQTPWKMLTIWWKTIFGKAIPAYMNEIKDDEKFVQKDDQGRYLNVFIKKAELGGKIGEVELEASEQIPVSDEQKRELIMELMSLNNMEIMQALVAPENLPFIRKVTKMEEFKLPGEDDRQKQYEEIQQLLDSAPVPQAQMDANTGKEIELPSLMVDAEVDNHEVEGAICRSWLVSEAGRMAKQDNPNGYQNVLLHYRAHLEIMKANMMAQQSMMAANQPEGKPNGNNDQKVNGEKDVKAPIS